MITPEMHSALEQMRALAAEVGGAEPRGRTIDAEVGREGFADALHGAVQRVNHLQEISGDQSAAFQAGAPGVALHDVLIDGQKASIAFEMGVQVRNRLVNAYKEIMNMPV